MRLPHRKTKPAETEVHCDHLPSPRPNRAARRHPQHNQRSKHRKLLARADALYEFHCTKPGGIKRVT